MKKVLIAFLILPLFVVSCLYCTYTRDEVFDFKCGAIDYPWGHTFAVLSWSNHNNYAGSPYTLSIGVYSYAEQKIENVTISAISVIVNNSLCDTWHSDRNHYLDSDFEIKRRETEKGMVDVHYFSANIASIELPHKPVTVKATLVLKSDNETIKETVEYKLEPVYRVEEGNAYLRAIRGI